MEKKPRPRSVRKGKQRCGVHAALFFFFAHASPTRSSHEANKALPDDAHRHFRDLGKYAGRTPRATTRGRATSAVGTRRRRHIRQEQRIACVWLHGRGVGLGIGASSNGFALLLTNAWELDKKRLFSVKDER